MSDSPPSSPATGLTEAEVKQKRAQGQGNTAQPPPGRTYGQIIRENVLTFINMILFGLGIALLLVGRPKDALVSVLVISSNIIISVVQEVRAKRLLDKIALLTRPKARVVRDGKEQQVGPEELVIGDLVRVGPGDQIVLDGKMVGDGSMQVDESQLTGESDLVPKKAGDPVYSGSFCVSGAGEYQVEKVGTNSLVNKITAGAKAFRRVLTPLQKHIYMVLRIMLLVAVYLELLLVIDAIVKRTDLSQSIANSTIIAGLVPNGLFLSISVAYALGAVRIVRSGALVQQSNAIESLSNVDMLCLDKTGTLTTNEIKLEEVRPVGIEQDELECILGVMAASEPAHNKTSEAIAAKYKREPCKPAAAVAFSSERKWSGIALDGCQVDGRQLNGVYILGAPEVLWPSLDNAAHDLKSTVDELAGKGLRVLLAAHSDEKDGFGTDDKDPRLPKHMKALGLVVLSDVLRKEAQSTLEAFRKAGVEVKIISGDNPETVAALAKQAGLGPEIHAVSGLDLDKMDDHQFSEAAEKDNIFGRIRPQQKERLISCLRDRGHYVAMIGDGVNDVLSLKKSNVGVSMESGSQATRSVADIILLGDTFAALPKAVEEGRRIVNGMRDILKLFLCRILSMALLIVSSMLIGFFPLAVRQVSLITFVAVAIPSMMLAVWAKPAPVTNLGPRLARFVLTPTLVTTVIGLLLFYSIYAFNLVSELKVLPPLLTAALQMDMSIVQATAQTVLALYLTITGLLLIVFVEPPTRWWTGGDVLSGDWRPTIMAGILSLMLVVVLVTPSFRDFFDLRSLNLPEYAILAGMTVAWLFLVRWFWRGRLLERFLGIRYQFKTE